VSHEDDGRARLTIERCEEIEDTATGCCVEISGWLVSKENSWRVGERAGEGDTLLLSARELHRKMVSPLLEPDFLEEIARALAGAVVALKLQRYGDVLPGSKRWYELESLKYETDFFATKACPLVLRHSRQVVAVEDHLATRRSIKSGEETEQCCLPASGRPDDCHEVALLYGERNVLEDGEVLVSTAVFPCNLLCNEHEDFLDCVAGCVCRVPAGAKYG